MHTIYFQFECGCRDLHRDHAIVKLAVVVVEPAPITTELVLAFEGGVSHPE
jgi:hypothetical protein